MVNLEKPWRAIRGPAGLDDVRLHDLRHAFASVAASSGMGLPIIGKMLGHSQPVTTARYAHLASDPVKAAAAAVAGKIAAAMGGGSVNAGRAEVRCCRCAPRKAARNRASSSRRAGLSESKIAMDRAIERVGRGLYAGDWIGELNERERWLIERYIDGPRSTILPVPISYNGRQWAELPSDPTLMAEADRARDRRDWMKAQYQAVFDRLEDCGFDPESDRIDKARFERLWPRTSTSARPQGDPQAMRRE